MRENEWNIVHLLLAWGPKNRRSGNVAERRLAATRALLGVCYTYQARCMSHRKGARGASIFRLQRFCLKNQAI